MPFSPDMSIPKSLKTDAFVLRPITAADAALDHAAVMESREYLRSWEQSTWPEDDFTVAANRADLAKLEKWNAEHLAFTYTVLDPTECECRGCVYVFPTNASMFQKAQIAPVDGSEWDEYEATVYFWVRKSEMEGGKDAVLLEALRHWIRSDWNLSRHLFVTNEQFEQQVQLLDSTDLRLRFTIDEPGKPGTYLAYGPA